MSLKLELVGERSHTCYQFNLCTNPCAVFCLQLHICHLQLQICHKGCQQLQLALQIKSGKCLAHNVHSQSVARLLEPGVYTPKRLFICAKVTLVCISTVLCVVAHPSALFAGMEAGRVLKRTTTSLITTRWTEPLLVTLTCSSFSPGGAAQPSGCRQHPCSECIQPQDRQLGEGW